MNKDIEITSIDIKEENDNTISVEIQNETEVLIAAHNASNEAHGGIISEVMEKIEALNGAINELEDNMVSTSSLPTKLSDFENDESFVSEQTVIDAIETRGLVNSVTLAQKETELQNLININANTNNTKFENIQNTITEATNPSLITDYCSPTTKRISLITAHTSTELTFTMPANGIFHCISRASNASGKMVLTRMDVSMDQVVNITVKDLYGSLEIPVHKNEVIKVWVGNAVLHDATFYYLGGNAPSETA